VPSEIISERGTPTVLSSGALTAGAASAMLEVSSAEADPLLMSATWASSDDGEDTAEPSRLPLVPLLTLGASGVTVEEEEESDPESDASATSVVVGADGVSIVLATGAASPVRSGAASCGGGAASATPPPLAAIDPA
jgi:hypothetical protein